MGAFPRRTGNQKTLSQAILRVKQPLAASNDRGLAANLWHYCGIWGELGVFCYSPAKCAVGSQDTLNDNKMITFKLALSGIHSQTCWDNRTPWRAVHLCIGKNSDVGTIM